MESLSRPPPPQRRKHSTATNSFPLKSPYDDDFVARSGRLSLLEPHDYTEIFAGSSSAPPSIPVLDLSGLDDRAGSGDFRVSVQDYSSIFGGLRNDDVAVPYQELFGGFAKRAKPPRKSAGIKSPLKYSSPLHSSENTKTDGISVDIQSPLKHSGSLDPSESAKRPTSEASNQSVERGQQQINVSFNKTSQMNSDALNGKTHVAELHSVPGFTYFVDGTPQQQKAEDCKPIPRSLKREVSRAWSFSTDIKEGKRGSRIPDAPHNRTEGNRSSKKPPSSSSPEKPSDAKRTRASDSASKEDSSEKSWPPFLDEEFDENSVAAASAAALKKAIDQAQESIRIAKMIMGRKKEGHPDRYKTRSSDGGEDLGMETKIRPSAEYEEADISFSVDHKRVPSSGQNAAVTEAGNVGAKLFTSGCSKNVEICVGEKVERGEDVSRGPKLFTSDGSQSEGVRRGEKAQLGTNVENAELAKECGEEFATGGWSFASLFRKGEKNIHVGEKVQLEMNGAAKGGHGEGLAWGAELVLSDCSSDGVCVREEVQPDNVESNEIDRERADFTGSEIMGRAEVSVSDTEPKVLVQLRDKTIASNSRHDPLDYVEVTEQSKTTFCHAKASRDIFEPAVDTLQCTTQGKVMDDAENKTSVEDEVARMRKSEECDEMHNWENWTSLESEFINFTIEASHIIGHKLLEQEVREKEAENVPRGEETEHSDEVEEVHLLFESKEPPEEVLEEEIDDRECSASPEMEEADKKIEPCEPEIDTVRSLAHESDATPEHEAAESLMRPKNEVFCDVEKTNSTFGETGRSMEDGSISDFQEVVYDDDIDEAVDSNTPGASPVFSETGYYPRTVNSNVENGTVPDVTEAKNAEAEPLFHQETDELPAVDTLRCSASEETILEGEQHNTFEDPSDGKAENVIITDSNQNLSEDEHAFEAVDEIYRADNAADDEEEFFPSVITDAIPEQEQILERDQGSESTCSPDNVDRFSAHESEDDAENVEVETSSKEETAVEEQELLCSQPQGDPGDDKFVEAKVTAEKSSNVEKEDAKKDIENAERQQRIEAIKRAREQEKDRLVVERAIREARERAFAEARERAVRAAVEKAASEARITDTQKKLDKAPAVKHPSDKAATSTEAKLRAERAAVERATVEVRERALEKALSQKTPAEPRADRNSVLKHSFSSSDLDSTYTESARRRRARLERHQRIMERAAKALAEKNMRDILAQKEQAERNRLAESLDVEIKRWATGKEGNLRALLSTLQYILGRDSSWQPISLTEIVTTAAVKKAYRKATLYVHPDKLQQRGASIQQKYICEKVFDLLKAAWNKFNSEER